MADNLPIHPLEFGDKSKDLNSSSRLIKSDLLRLPELLQYLERHVVVGEEVVGHGEADPGGALGRAELEQLVAGVLEGKDNQIIYFCQSCYTKCEI